MPRHGFSKHLAHINSRPRNTDSGLRLPIEQPERLAVAISAQTGSGAHHVAEELARYLQANAVAAEPPWRVFDRTLMAKVLEDHHLPARLAKFLPEDVINTDRFSDAEVVRLVGDAVLSRQRASAERARALAPSEIFV